MSIPIICSCGARMHAPERYAGRKTRCPKCHKALIVPNVPAPVEPQTAAPEGAAYGLAQEDPPLTTPSSAIDYLETEQNDSAPAREETRAGVGTTLRQLWMNFKRNLPFIGREPTQYRIRKDSKHSEVLTVEEMRARILSGELHQKDRVRRLPRDSHDQPGPWQTLAEAAFHEFRLGVLYTPLRSHMRQGIYYYFLSLPGLMVLAGAAQSAQAARVTGVHPVLAAVGGAILFPLLLVLGVGAILLIWAVGHTLFASSNPAIKVIGFVLAVPFFPIILQLVAGVAVIALTGALLGLVVGLARLPFLPRAPAESQARTKSHHEEEAD